jgi:hypothetical protein
MSVQARVGAHLAVLGTALVVAGLHGVVTHDATTPVAVAVTETYRPPAFVPASPNPVRVHTLAGTTTKPAAKRLLVAKPASAATRASATTRHATATPRHAATTSFASALAAAVARIPTYRAGAARWVVSSAYDFWGTADWYDDVLYVNPDVPADKLYDVAVHEWSHELSVLDYNGDVNAAMAAMNAWFGGTSLTGAERAADCMAILQGATWTHYTTCTDATWRAGAAKLLAGQQL